MILFGEKSLRRAVTTYLEHYHTELERLKKLKLPQQSKWIIKTKFKNGTTMYNIADPKQSIFMVRPDVRRLIPMSYDAKVTTEYWDDDGSPEYRTMFKRIETDGVVLQSAAN